MVLRSLIVRGVWGSGLDTLLRDLRGVIKSHGGFAFPVAAIEQVMAYRGKSLSVTDVLVDDILSLEYGKARTFAVLAVLFPHVDTRNQFHVDHVFPAARFDKKELASHRNSEGTPRFTVECIDELVSLRDRLPNLQLLPGLENIGKSDKAPEDWLAVEFPSPDERSAFLARHALPSPLPHSVDDFTSFFEQRRANLTARILDKFKVYSPEAVGLHPDPSPADLDEEIAEGDYED